MKKVINIFIAVLLIANASKAQYVTIPDANFKAYLISQYPTCFNGAGEMDTTCYAVVNETRLDCSNKSINSVEGLQYFKKLSTFIGEFNNITSLPALPDSLTIVAIAANINLSCLPKLPKGIISLDLSNTNVQCLPNAINGAVVPFPLAVCNATNNPNNCAIYNPYVTIPDATFRAFLISKYPFCFNAAGQMDTTCSGVLNATGLFLYTPTGAITNLDGIKYFKGLDTLDCASNPFSNLVLPDSLTTLYCGNILTLTSLPSLPNTLTTLFCGQDDNLTSLPALPSSLKSLNCYSCHLTSLPPLPNSLSFLNCDRNFLTGLPSLPASLDTLVCDRNSNLHCLPLLPQSLKALYIDSINIPCLPNNVNAIKVFDNNVLVNMPVCNATNNPNNCAIYNPYVTIPDYNFRTYLINRYPTCFNSNFPNPEMDTTCSAVVNETALTFNYKSALNITGIEYFKNLRYLDCGFNSIDSLVKLPKTLKTILFNNNPISKFPVLTDEVEYVNLSFTGITKINALPSKLKHIFFQQTPIDTLPVLPDSLKELSMHQDGWAYLSSGLFNPKMPLSKVPAIPNTVEILQLDGGTYTTVPALPNTLKKLVLINSDLSHLSKLPDSLTLLDLSYDSSLFCIPKLPNKLVSLDLSTLVACIPNFPTTLTHFYPDNLTVCNPTNNVNQCQSYSIVYGKVFTDNNSNGIKDANEFYKPNVKLVLNTGQSVVTNSNGEYTMSINGIGNYTLKGQHSDIFKFAPDSANFSFVNDTAALYLADFALQPIATKDSLAVKVSSIRRVVRPGFSAPYLVSYENDGTTTLNPTIVFNYDNTRLNFDSSNNVSVTNNGNSLSLNKSGFAAGQSESFIAYFTVKSNAVFGETVKSNVSITGGSASASDSINNVIVNSFDPNDKAATPELTTAQVANGDYIDYTIRFQNTGNDTAFNVVLADTLSNLLQANSLELVSSSHNCKTSVADGIAYFEFLNINLVDSVHNEKGSHGFVRFKVKPLSTLINGDSVNNKASVYFDYNSPVITNTATTKIKNPIIVPLKLLSFNGNALENGNNLLYWNTANEINTQSFIIQQSLDGRVFVSVGEVKAKGSGEYRFTDNRVPLTAFYRLMIKDNDGSFSFSKIIVIKSAISNPKFEIAGNPIKNELVITGISNSLMNTEATLINNMGLVVKRFVLNASTQTINVSSLSNGIYYLRTVEGNCKVVVSK